MNTQETSAGSISRKEVKKVLGAIFATTALVFTMGVVNADAAIWDDEYVEKIQESDFAIETIKRFGLEEEYNEYVESKNADDSDDTVYDNGTEHEEDNIYSEAVAEEQEKSEDETGTEETTVRSDDEIEPMTSYEEACSYANKLYTNTDLNIPSGISREKFISYIKGMPSRHDPNGFYQRNAGYIWDTCQEVGFNEFAFIGVSSWEGGWAAHGVSYNYYGTLGMRYSSERDGIYGWISYMKNNYINPSGKYYKGPDLKNIGPTYCSSGWTYDVISRCQDSALRV